MDFCGLLTCTNKPVPLRSISVDAVIRSFVADVVSELRYQNEEENPVEVRFVFPLDAVAAVYAFEGLIGGTRIEAQIREKKQAQQEYEDALTEGRQAFLLERERSSSDIFVCTLGNLPPDGEAVLKLSYVQALDPEPDGAIRFVLPAVLNPRYVPQDSATDTITKSIPRVPRGQLPYTLSLCAKLQSPYGIDHVESKCSLEPMRYTAEDHTAAEVALAGGYQFDQDVELLIYYKDVHKASALLESGKPGAPAGSLMGDPALLLSLYPSVPPPKPDQNATGEFIFLLDRSGSMDCRTDHTSDSSSRIQSAKETLILLLKSLPLGCHFNIFGFGSSYDSFYPKSVEYTQDTMSVSLKWVKNLKADLGGTEILQPLKAIYRQPYLEGHPRQLFVFTDGEVHNTDEVIAEVSRHRGSHRCFSFGIGEGASTALIKGIAQAASGSAEFITGKERIQAKALQSLKKALQPAVTGISLKWNLPPGLEAKLVGSGHQVIFPGHHCLLYAQIHGQHQPSGPAEGHVLLQYTFQDQTFTETMTFPLQAQETDRMPVHRLAAKFFLQELEQAGEKEEEKQHLALETSLSSGVVCSQTAYVGVNTELGKTFHTPLIHRDVPLMSGFWSTYSASCLSAPSPLLCLGAPSQGALSCEEEDYCEEENYYGGWYCTIC
ncbi:von Willebrand factor A domain-containing protein 5A-like isoform X2 [Varanus komodoensis]|uniref:von Willebrand factor A domain-containing protein 5A-like isoform X2 n=1 Tax=Varanus komodoensis TaxID=61221 RepID=UPI001CF7A618|nr:von Willebrand factor A domain-containing protein 5A-like isoform X2 [Varanus komodoensis]